MRVLYTIVFTLALPFIVLRLLVRSMREPGYRKHIAERFGLCRKRTNNNKYIWLHAVSVGEQVAAAPLVRLIQEQGYAVHITVTTAAGRARAETLYPNLTISYLPLDIPLFWTIFLKRVQPQQCLIMEAELWPNLFIACNNKKIPISLVNSRLSDRSAKRYCYIKKLLAKMFTNTRAGAQTEADKINLAKIGINAQKIEVLGNLKESITISQAQLNSGSQLRSSLKLENTFIWVAASTHPGEDEVVIAAHKEIIKTHPAAKLILAPRHIQRCPAIIKLINDADLSWQYKDKYRDEHIILWNTMGELITAYALADVAVVCGSFAEIGGHNILEPAATATAVIVGPQHYKITTHLEHLRQFNAIEVAGDAHELADILLNQAQDKKYKITGANAERAVASLGNTAQKYLQWLNI